MRLTQMPVDRRRRRLALSAAWSVLACGVGVTAESAAAERIADATVLAVVDGDTVAVLLDGARCRVRLVDIDAPELSQPHGRDAAVALRHFLGRRRVRLHIRGSDVYGRLLARVVLDGTDAGSRQVGHGWAWASRGRGHGPVAELFLLEVMARAQKRGLWASPDPVPPWEWRRAKA